MIELYQTEWCPASRRVRQRLTELGIDYVIRQVAADPAKRELLVELTGASSVPILVADDGRAVVGEEDIVEYVDAHFEEPAGAWAHRARAAKARRRYLSEECTCLPAATH